MARAMALMTLKRSHFRYMALERNHKAHNW
jgi:hypothetical protein